MIFIWSGAYANEENEETKENKEDLEEELEETQQQLHEQNGEEQNEEEGERQGETENGCDDDEEDMSSDEQNEDQDSDYERQETEVDSPQTDPPVVRSKSKKKIKHTCEKCHKNCSTSAGLKSHKRYCKGDETELGPVGKKKINDHRQRAKVHKETPACGKQHKCPHCDESFTQTGQLKVCSQNAGIFKNTREVPRESQGIAECFSPSALLKCS